MENIQNANLNPDTDNLPALPLYLPDLDFYNCTAHINIHTNKQRHFVFGDFT